MKLICFDLDGTIIDDTEFIWYTLHEHFGLDLSLVKKWHKRFMDKEITYDEWFSEDIKWWKSAGARKKDFFDAVKKLSLMKGAYETVNELKKRGHKLAIISGSLNIVVEHFFPEHTFDHVYVNEIYFDHKGKISGRKTTPYDYEHKATGLLKIAAQERIPISDTVFVGDNENDIDALKTAGLGIAFNAKSKKVEKAADVVVREKDMSRILAYL